MSNSSVSPAPSLGFFSDCKRQRKLGFTVTKSPWCLVGNGGMDPYSSPYIIPIDNPKDPFPHSLLSIREKCLLVLHASSFTLGFSLKDSGLVSKWSSLELSRVVVQCPNHATRI